MIRYIVNEIKYFDYLKEHYFKDHEARWTNVGEMISIAQQTPLTEEDQIEYLVDESSDSVDIVADDSDSEKK